MDRECIPEIEEIKYRIFAPAHEQHLEEDRYHERSKHEEESELPCRQRHNIYHRQFSYLEIAFNEMVVKRIGACELGRVLSAGRPKFHIDSLAGKRFQDPHHVRS